MVELEDAEIDWGPPEVLRLAAPAPQPAGMLLFSGRVPVHTLTDLPLLAYFCWNALPRASLLLLRWFVGNAGGKGPSRPSSSRASGSAGSSGVVAPTSDWRPGLQSAAAAAMPRCQGRPAVMRGPTALQVWTRYLTISRITPCTIPTK